MSDEQSLLVVLALLYLAECVFWVRRDWVAFSSPFRNHYRLKYPEGLGVNQQGRFLLSNTLPPLGSVFLCQQWPLFFSPDAVYSPPTPTGTTFGKSEIGGKIGRAHV